MQASDFLTWSNFILLSILFLLVTSFSISISSSFSFYPKVANAQPITLKEMVTYENNENSAKGSTAMPGQYTVVVRATVFENKNYNSVVSLLYPVQIRLDMPPPSPSTQSFSQQTYHKSLLDFSSLRGILRFLALVIAIGLIAYLVYRRIKRSRNVKQQDRPQ